VTSSYLFGIFVRAPLIVLDTAVMGSISYATAFFDPTGEKQLKVARAWARHLLACAGARVTVVGLERLDPRACYVLCPNHVSYMDTPVLLANVPNSFRFLAKEELFRIPFIGGHLERAGNISVPLEDPRAALRVLSQAGKGMREKGVSMLVFPEGGRSESGELQPFKDGAALLAIKAQAPMVPIGIIGVRDVLPMHSHHVRPGRVTLRIGNPIPTEGKEIRDRTALTERLSRDITALIAQGHA
jgi:1-acyl-sn-glycerol-3-phosphate acyltransferase